MISSFTYWIPMVELSLYRKMLDWFFFGKHIEMDAISLVIRKMQIKTII